MSKIDDKAVQVLLNQTMNKWEGLTLSITPDPTTLSYRLTASVLSEASAEYAATVLLAAPALTFAYDALEVIQSNIDMLLDKLMLNVPMKMVQEKPMWKDYPSWTTATNTLSYKDIVNAYQAVAYPTPVQQGSIKHDNLKNLMGINKAVGAKDLANHKLPPKEEKILTAEEFYVNPPKVTQKEQSVAAPYIPTSFAALDEIIGNLEGLSKSLPKTPEEAKKKAYLTEELKAAYAGAMHKMAKPIESAPFQASVDAEMEQLDKAMLTLESTPTAPNMYHSAWKDAKSTMGLGEQPWLQYLLDQLTIKESK